MPTDSPAQVKLRPRPAVERMAPYAPPTGSRQGLARNDFNENTLGPSPKVVEAVRERATRDFLATYPEYEAARAKLGGFLGVDPDQLLFSAGSDEAIHVLVQAYVGPGDEAIVLDPSFPMFRFYVEVADARPVEIPYRQPDLSFPVDELIAAVTDRTRAILIATPNNPTGTVCSLDDVERICRAAPQAAVLIDEAYFEFRGVTAIPLLAEHPNLFVSRTFSKAYGLAAFRVGYLVSQAANTALVHKAQSPYSVNALGIAAAMAAIDDQQYLREYVEEVLAARAELYEALQALDVGFWKSHANFVLCRFGGASREICRGMRERGWLIRDRSREIPGTIRITVGTREQTRGLIAALRETLEEVRS